MDDILKSLFVAIGFKSDDASKEMAKRSVKDYEQSVIQAEKAIEDARWAGAKTEQDIAKLTRETNLKLAKEALEKAKAEERQRQETEKKQAEQIKVAKQRIGDFLTVVTGIGAAISTAALGVHAGVVKMAESFDTLQFTSQRTGTTVRSIQAIGYAASQMGSSVGASVASLENFARTLRQSPGSYSMLERLGIKTTDANGAKRTADALFQDFGKALKNKPGFLQDQYLEDFGIDEKTGRAIIQGLDKYTEEYNDKLLKTGLDPDKAAKDAAALQRTFGSMAASFEIIGQKVASRLFQGENNGFQKFVDWLDKHGDQIAEVIAHIAQVVVELAKALLELVTSPEAKKWFDTLLSAFGEFNKETGKFEANVDKMKIALGLLGAYVATDWLKKILGAFGLLGLGWSGLLRTFGIPVAIGTVATAHGYQTPEQYQESLATDPEAKRFDDERKAQGGGLKRLIQRGYNAVKRTLTGGGAEAHTGGGQGAGTGTPSGSDAGNLTALIEREARAAGIDPRIMQGIRAGESGKRHNRGNPRAAYDHNPGTRAIPEDSWGPFQLNRLRGTGQEFERDTGLDLSDPKTIPDQVRYVAQYLRKKYAKNPNYSPFPNWQGYKGNRDADPRWGDSGYVPTPTTAGSPPPVSGRPVAGLDGQVGTDLGNGTMRMPSGAIRSIPANAPTASAPAAPKPPATTVKDVFPNGMPPVFQGGKLPSFITSPQAPSFSSADNSRSMTVNVNNTANVTGVPDEKRAAEHVGTVQGYHTSDLIRNMRPLLA